RRDQRAIDVGEPLMELRPRTGGVVSATSGKDAQRTAVLGFEHGLHARPAATVAKAAQAFQAEITVSGGGRRANAKSPVSLMTLGAGEGDTLTIDAIGADAEAAADVTARALSGNARPAKSAPPIETRAATTDGEIIGTCAAPGLTI